ncbi:MAG: LytTR family transcriptional regulator DNA-binding domain-containing protein, partial [Tannerella sp.]|nr:LytTR family transcriptional regulator DNA-binding domain-containing protein [Tannerella sp.]
YIKSYVAACFTVAAIYAFAVGSQSGVWTGGIALALAVADALIYGIMLCLTGFILWNVYRFATPAHSVPKYNFIAVMAITLLTGISVTGIESLAVYLSFPSQFGMFASTIPVRTLITLLIYIIVRLLYLAYCKREVAVAADPCNESQPEQTAGKPVIERFTVRVGQKIKIIPVSEVIFIRADGDYISINTAESSFLKEQTMNEAENTLPTDSFVRIHRSYIVNINFISRIERYGEKQQVMLSGGEKIRISAARYRTLKQILGF